MKTQADYEQMVNDPLVLELFQQIEKDIKEYEENIQKLFNYFINQKFRN